jgi:hypothetical protein
VQASREPGAVQLGPFQLWGADRRSRFSGNGWARDRTRLGLSQKYLSSCSDGRSHRLQIRGDDAAVQPNGGSPAGAGPGRERDPLPESHRDRGPQLQ